MSTQRPENRAQTVALVGLILQGLFALLFVLLAAWSQSQAVRGLALLASVGCVIWLLLVLIYHQRVLVVAEEFETEQLQRQRQSTTGTDAIFDVADEQLLLARRRLRWMYRWLLPAGSLVIIGLLLVAALVRWKWGFGESLSSKAWGQVQHTGLLMSFVGGGAFLSFLLSRYATGMARQREWRMLRAGAGYLMGITLSAAAVAVALGLLHVEQFGRTPVPERVVAYALRLLMLVLAVEAGLNQILDLYRPRAADEEPRPAFDSRLLGLFTEPGGIARSIAEAINYQFGFEVSSTWFYKLLERSVVPLAGFGVATLFAASCLVVVGGEEEAVIERFGEKTRLLGPGAHAKWPWPIEKAFKVATARVHELKIGTVPEGQEKKEKKDNQKPDLILWTTEHEQEPHLNVLVAAPNLAKYLNLDEQPEGPGEPAATQPADAPATRPGERRRATEGEAVPVSQLRVAVVLQYEIRDAYQWLVTYDDPEATLEAIAKREITRYCAGVDAPSLLGGDRARIERALHQSIQSSAEARGLGIDIRFLGLQGVHPPKDTAEAFQDVIGAESKRMASTRSARADRNKSLSEVAGEVDRAVQLYDAIVRLGELDASPGASQDQLRPARQRVDTLFFGDADRGIRPVGGSAAEKIVQATEARWRAENRAHGEAAGFDAEMDTKNAAPQVYRMRRYFEALAEALPGIRKYVIAAEGQHTTETFHLNLQDARDIPFEGAAKKKEP